MRIQIRDQGLPEAVEMMALIGNLGSDIQGVELHGLARKGANEKGTNADVKEYLAEGGRDLGPNDADAKKAAEAYVAVVQRYLKSITQRVKPMPRLGTKAHAAAVKRQARVKKAQAKGKKGASQADARAFRKAGKAVAAIIAKRIEKGEDMNGQVKPVGQDYAAQRALQHSMPDDTHIVFIRSGQLLANYAAGRLKLVKK
jgi:hypothetical protein